MLGSMAYCEFMDTWMRDQPLEQKVCDAEHKPLNCYYQKMYVQSFERHRCNFIFQRNNEIIIVQQCSQQGELKTNFNVRNHLMTWSCNQRGAKIFPN